MTGLEREAGRLARELAAALMGFANRIDEGVTGQEGSILRLIESAPYLGFRQKQILQLPDLASDRGVTTGEVAGALRMTQPNAHLTLKGMVERGWVEKLDTLSPHRYRLVDEYR